MPKFKKPNEEEKELQEKVSIFKDLNPIEKRDIQEKLFNRYSRLVKSIVNKICRGTSLTEDDIDDVISDVMVDLISTIPSTYKPIVNLSQYVSMKSKFCAIDSIRKNGRFKRSFVKKSIEKGLRVTRFCDIENYNNQNHFVDSNRESIVDYKEDIDEYEEIEKYEFCSKILGSLSHFERQVLKEYYFEGKTMKEIAESYNISESRICQVSSKAKEMASKVFKEEYETLF